MAEEKKIPYKIYLEESEMPKAWYNVRADMKNKPAPLLNPGTHQPMTAEELGGVFCEELVQQELDNDTPLYRDSAGDPRFLQDVSPFSSCAGILSGKKASDPGKDLLQI